MAITPGWQFERIYTSDGSELSNAQLTTTLSGAYAMKEDGRYLWVTNGTNGVYIYQWWGAASDDEPAWNTLDLLNLPAYDTGIKKKLRLVTAIDINASTIIRTTREPSLADVGATSYTLGTEGESTYSKTTTRTGSALDAKFIAKLGAKMYVTNGASFSEIYEFDISTQQPTGTVFNVSETFNGTSRAMNSNLCASGGRLWFVGGYSILEAQDTSRQQLYALDPTTGTITAYPLTSRPSLARTWLADGYNGYVYATCFNDVAVMKVDNLTGSMTELRVNAFTTRIESGQDRRIWVSSYAGMLSLIDFDDDQVHNDYSTETAGCQGMQTDLTDATEMWYVSAAGKLVRYNLNTLQQLESTAGNDWSFTHPSLSAPSALLITAPLSYTDANANPVDVLPYVFMIQGSQLLAFRLYKYLYREAFAELNGNGAVASGSEFYFGES
jgi:hypothetical protein